MSTPTALHDRHVKMFLRRRGLERGGEARRDGGDREGKEEGREEEGRGGGGKREGKEEGREEEGRGGGWRGGRGRGRRMGREREGEGWRGNSLILILQNSQCNGL